MAENDKGPNKKDIEIVRNYLREIEELYKKLEGTNPFKGMDPKKLASSSDEVNRLKSGLREAREAVSDMEGEAGDLFKSWKAISDEVKGYRRVLNDSKGTVSKVNDLSKKLADHQNKTNQLSSKELNSLKSQLEQQKSILKGNRDSLKATVEELSAKKKSGNISATELSQLKEAEGIYNNINEGLKEENGLLDSIINKTEQEAKSLEDIETKLGVVGGLFKGISQIPILNNLVDADKILKASHEEIERSGSSLKGLSAGFKEMGSQIMGGVLNPANLAASAITKIYEAMVSSDKAAGDLAKSMNITYTQALDVRKELTDMASASLDNTLNTQNLQETLTAVNSALGTTGKLSENDLKIFTKLREQAGMTNEEIMGMQKYTMATGGDLEDNVKSFQASAKLMSYQKGVALNTKKLMAEMATVSNRTKLSIEGGADGLAKAAVSAKLMGSNLDNVAGIADSLLQFETSIENELSAELLLGKDINLEKARQAALNNDLATVAEEITKQAGSAAEFSKMNRIQQEALAKAVGMNADQLADTLVEQEALKAVGHALNDEEKAAYETAKEKYGAEKAAKMLKEGQLDQLVEQQSIQERYNESMEKMNEIFVQLAEPLLQIIDPFVELLTTILPGITAAIQVILTPIQWIADLVGMIGDAFTWVGEKIGALIGPLGTVGKILKGLASLAVVYAAYKTFAAVSGALAATVIGGLAAPFVGAAAAAAVTTAGFGLLSGIKANDIVAPAPGGSGYGKRTLLGPEGAIQLNDKDTVIAGTNLFGDKGSSEKADDMMSSPKGTIQVANSTAPKKETPPDPSAGTNARLDALIATTGKVNSISTLRIQ
jgi:hypothetical protein